MKYAVHLSDLMVVPAWHPIHLILDPFLMRETVQLDATVFDAHGVVVAELPDREFLAAVAVAQMHNLPG